VPDEGGTHLWVHRGNIAGSARGMLTAGERVEFEARKGGMCAEAINVRSAEA